MIRDQASHVRLAYGVCCKCSKRMDSRLWCYVVSGSGGGVRQGSLSSDCKYLLSDYRMQVGFSARRLYEAVGDDGDDSEVIIETGVPTAGTGLRC